VQQLCDSTCQSLLKLLYYFCNGLLAAASKREAKLIVFEIIYSSLANLEHISALLYFIPNLSALNYKRDKLAFKQVCWLLEINSLLFFL
jgi:hypothetical protein